MNRYGEQVDNSTIKFERLLPGPIERVWAFLIDPDKRRQWFCAGDFDLEPGGKAEFHFDHRRITNDSPPKGFEKYGGAVEMAGEIVEASAPNLLVFDWPDPTGADTRVRIELEEAGDKVKLTLVHSGLSSRDSMIETSSGWHGHLDILEAALAVTTAPGFWTAFEMLVKEYAKRFAKQ